jgi:ribosomal protein S18 acetylase RimI-like enzyme
MLASDAPATTAALLDAVLERPEAANADRYAACLRQGSPGLAPALASHGFDVAIYRYLTMPPRRFPPRRAVVRGWTADDVDPLVRVFSRAYADPHDVRAFAPGGTDAEWLDYLMGLVAGPGCGDMVRSASFVSTSDAGEPDAAILSTMLSRDTGHIAQIAVDPAAQGRGLATELIERAVTALAERQFRQVTLLVSDENRKAARIYARLGFRERGAFVVALNRQPRRLSSVALATGGASTRR